MDAQNLRVLVTYGEFDMEKYKELEELLNPDTVDETL